MAANQQFVLVREYIPSKEAMAIQLLLTRAGIPAQLGSTVDACVSEVWVPVDDRQKSLELLSTFKMTDPLVMDAWRCLFCQEENPGSFEICWNCKGSKEGLLL